MMTRSQHFRTSVLLFGLGLAVGCGGSAPTRITRIHMENASDSPLTLIAVGFSEQEVERAPNRLLEPLEPDSVYSALLSRPGNYWVRTEVEERGHTIERIEGPLRVSRGILDWQFKEIDVRPLYDHGARPRKDMRPSGLALAQPAAGRMSFSSN